MPPPYPERSNVLVFVDFGPGPYKMATGQYGEQLRFRQAKSPVRSARLKVNGAAVSMPPYDDLYYQASTRGGRVMDHVLANQAVFKSVTGTAGDAALISGAILATDHDTAEIGIGLLAVGAISKMLSAATIPEADTRAWNNLPLYLSFAALDLPAGDHVVTVEFLGEYDQALGNLTKTINLHVPPGPGDVVVYLSDQSVISNSL